jgi:hypothetical protein
MKVILDGHFWKDGIWNECSVQVVVFDGCVEISLQREGYDDEPILLNQAELNYAIKTIELAPDYDNEGGAK